MAKAKSKSKESVPAWFSRLLVPGIYDRNSIQISDANVLIARFARAADISVRFRIEGYRPYRALSVRIVRMDAQATAAHLLTSVGLSASDWEAVDAFWAEMGEVQARAEEARSNTLVAEFMRAIGASGVPRDDQE